MKTNKQTDAMLAAALASLKPLNLSQIFLTQPAPIPFGDALTRALDRSRGSNRAATQRSYQRAAGKLSRAFGVRDIHGISLADYEAFLASLHKATGEPLSAATKNLYVFLIRLAAHEAGLRTPLPRRLPVLQRAPRFYTQGEVAHMIAAVRPEERGYVIVQSHFGLRSGEALQLQPEQIDLNDRTIMVPGASITGLVRVIAGRPDASYFGSYVPDGAWRLLAAYPFQPPKRSPKVIEQVMRQAVGRWIPGGLRITAAANLGSLMDRTSAAQTLGVSDAMLTRHFVLPMTLAQARDYFDLDPGQFSQAAA